MKSCFCWGIIIWLFVALLAWAAWSIAHPAPTPPPPPVARQFAGERLTDQDRRDALVMLENTKAVIAKATGARRAQLQLNYRIAQQVLNGGKVTSEDWALFWRSLRRLGEWGRTGGDSFTRKTAPPPMPVFE